VRQDGCVSSLRLLSVDARNFGRDRAALAAAIAAEAPDVVCVHGGPHLLRWRSISAAIARRAGLVVVTGGRTAGANLLLSTLGVDVCAVRDVRLTANTRWPVAGAALAALKAGGREFVLAAAELAGNAAQRSMQARELRSAIARLVPGTPPVVVSVRDADRPGTATWQVLVEDAADVAGRVFVDGRITLAEATEATSGYPVAPAVRVGLAL
jgi:hypothetical protein